jgi:hypothetical protein
VHNGARDAEIGIGRGELLIGNFQAAGTIRDARIIRLGNQLDVKRQRRLVIAIPDL